MWTGKEIDILLEDRAVRPVSVVVKAAATVTNRDLRMLKALLEFVGESFRFGAALHTGSERIPFASNLHALCVQTLREVKEGSVAAS